jgi:hypothetical protein
MCWPQPLRRLDNSYARLVSEMREIRGELRTMRGRQQLASARVRALKDRST